MKDQRERFAKSIAFACVRSTFVEKIHEGKEVRSQSGDYSDVKVVTPYGEIAWNDVSRITEEEMKGLMKEVVNKLYTVLVKFDDPEFIAALNDWSDRNTGKWDKPELRPGLVVREK